MLQAKDAVGRGNPSNFAMTKHYHFALLKGMIAIVFTLGTHMGRKLRLLAIGAAIKQLTYNLAAALPLHDPENHILSKSWLALATH